MLSEKCRCSADLFVGVGISENTPIWMDKSGVFDDDIEKFKVMFYKLCYCNSFENVRFFLDRQFYFVSAKCQYRLVSIRYRGHV